MGLLGNFNFDDPETMGLLTAGLNMIGNSGKGGNMNTAQILAGGVGAGMNGAAGVIQARQMMAMQKQKQEHDDLVMQSMKMENMQRQSQMESQQRLQDFQKTFSAQQQDPSAQAMQAMGGNLSPTVANAGTLNQLRSQATAQSNDPYEERMRWANGYRAAGFKPQAEAEEISALKFRPEYDQTPRVGTGADGKPFTYVMDKQGNPKVLSGILPREELHFGDDGQSLVGQNKFTGDIVSRTKKQQTLESLAANGLGYARLNQEKQFHKDTQANASKPTWNNEVGAFIAAPDTQNPNGRQIPLSGYTKPDKPLTEFQGKASLFASRMENSNKIMSELNANGTKTPSLIKSTLEGVPLIGGGLGVMANFGANPEQQKLEQSQRDFVNAVLRQESGAAISEGEFSSAKKQYFPAPGDSNEVVAQKADNRAAAIKGMVVQAGPGATQIGIGKSDKSSPKTKLFKLDGGGSTSATLGADGKYYVVKNGKKYSVEE